MKAEIYTDRVGRLQARIGTFERTGHSILEDSGHFTVVSILTENLLRLDASRHEAEAFISNEWATFTTTRLPQTSREREQLFDSLSRERKLADMLLRNHLAEKDLRPRLRTGDRLRANKAECGSREATFTFSHWERGWIVSTGTNSIAPGSVYSVNGKVLRV